jgi:NADH-quinone oxidoreductase subunit C
VSHLPSIKPRAGLAEACGKALGSRLIASAEHLGEVTLTIERDALVEAARILRDDLGYQQLMEIAGVDYPERAERFEVNYHFLSLTENHRIRLKLSTDEATPVPSLTALWPVAGWLEREVFDLFGVTFAGNSDLRRILTDYGFEGHPLRKDFPQTGYVELRYSEAEKRVVYEPVHLPQDFRNFDFLMPWEGAQYALPGDEKAGQAPGAPTPAPAPASPPPQSKSPPPTPKVTETTAATGAGAPANAAAKREARKPRAAKASSAGGKASTTSEPKPGRKPRAPKGDA